MRFRHTTHNVEDLTLDMTPMIDMTFQLIAFFMFVLNFNNDLIDERVRLPVADQATPTEDAPISPVYINMSADGSVYLPGGVEVDPRSDAGNLRRSLEQEARLARLNMKAAGKDVAQEGLWTTVIIRAHKDAPYGAVQNAIKVAREIGFQKFWLRAQSNR